MLEFGDILLNNNNVKPNNRIIKHLDFTESAFSLTCRVGEVEDAGGRLQQVGAAGRQVAGDGHDGHAVATLLGTHDAVVLRLTHATIAREKIGRGTKEDGVKDGVRETRGGMTRQIVCCKRKKERERKGKIRFSPLKTNLMFKH